MRVAQQQHFQYHAHRERWYCIACNAYVDAGHLDTPKHRHRSVNSAYWSIAPGSETDEPGDEQAAGTSAPHSQERGPGNPGDTAPAYLPPSGGRDADGEVGEALRPSHRLNSAGECPISDGRDLTNALCCRCKQPMDCSMARRDQALRTSAGSGRARCRQCEGFHHWADLRPGLLSCRDLPCQATEGTQSAQPGLCHHGAGGPTQGAPPTSGA